MDNSYISDDVRNYAYKYVAPFFYIFGIIGSCACIIILQELKFSSKFYTYLKALAICDLFFIVFVISRFTRQISEDGMETLTTFPAENLAREIYQNNVEKPLINIFLATSAWIVSCMTIDR